MAIVLSKTGLETTGVWLAWPIGWTIATVMSLIFYRAKIHKRNDTVLTPETIPGE